MKALVRFLMLPALFTIALSAESAARPKPKRPHWLRRIGRMEVALGERVSAIRLQNPPAASTALPPAPAVPAPHN